MGQEIPPGDNPFAPQPPSYHWLMQQEAPPARPLMMPKQTPQQQPQQFGGPHFGICSGSEAPGQPNPIAGGESPGTLLSTSNEKLVKGMQLQHNPGPQHRTMSPVQKMQLQDPSGFQFQSRDSGVQSDAHSSVRLIFLIEFLKLVLLGK
jgi:hypothetical protein